MIFGDKKGLSDVITNVLIILLVIVAVGIIAAFLFPLIRNSTDNANEGVSCLNVDVLPISCSYLQLSANSFNANVTIKRGSGGYVLDESKVVLTKQDGSSDVKILSASNLAKLGEFATIIEQVNAINYPPKNVQVSVKLKGSRNSCSTSQTIACSACPTLSCSQITDSTSCTAQFGCTPTTVLCSTYTIQGQNECNAAPPCNWVSFPAPGGGTSSGCQGTSHFSCTGNYQKC
ncbi:MAG: type IV pilin [Nanoarchaeota archaeon]|nr:type IV pilin [Nanoarchaeota archaeon]